LFFLTSNNIIYYIKFNIAIYWDNISTIILFFKQNMTNRRNFITIEDLFYYRFNLIVKRWFWLPGSDCKYSSIMEFNSFTVVYDHIYSIYCTYLLTLYLYVLYNSKKHYRNDRKKLLFDANQLMWWMRLAGCEDTRQNKE